MVKVNPSSHTGQRIREQRKALGWTQDEAASKCGVSREMWGKYERGVAKPGSETLAAMGAGGMDVAYILTGQTPALREALNDVKVSTEAAAMMGGTKEERAEYQATIFNTLRVGRAKTEDELALLIDYRLCIEPDQQQIRSLAARLRAHPPPPEPDHQNTKKGGTKK